MIFRLVTISICLLISQVSQAKKYMLDELKLEAQFEALTDVTNATMAFFDKINMGALMEGGNRSYAIAGALAAGEVILPMVSYFFFSVITAFTGGFGLILLPAAVFCGSIATIPYHRFYLGTDGNKFEIGMIYCATLGVLNMTDIFFLASTKKGDEQFFDNGKPIMWAGAELDHDKVFAYLMAIFSFR